MSNTLGYLRGELKDAGKTSSTKGKKPVSFGKREALINGTPELLPALAKKVFDRSKIEKGNLINGELGG